MTTSLKIEANRKNASRSSGPRTAAGKARTSRNALRHGLSVSILDDDPEVSVAAERLACRLLDAGGNASLLRHARLVAQAELEILRVRAARIALIKTLAQGLDAEEGGTRMLNAFLRALPQLLALERYERRTLSRRKRLVRDFSMARSISTG
jgi:hypothetical protein